MPRETHRLGVLARRTPPANRWSRGALTPCAVLLPESPLPPRTRISAEGGTEVWYLGAADLTLYSGDTAHHRDNLVAARPAVWVAIRGGDPLTAEIMCVTADPYEGEGYATDEGLTVEAVDLPPTLAGAMQAFVAAHHIDIPFKKRKRQPVDPNALQSTAPRILSPDQKWGPKR
jgi:hypothetical protein